MSITPRVVSTSISLPKEELDSWREAAWKARLSLSAWIRQQIKPQPITLYGPTKMTDIETGQEIILPHAAKP